MAALPLKIDEVAFGTLVIYSGDAPAFESDEIALLEELAGNLAYGVQSLRVREAAARGDAERQRLWAAVEHSAESVVVTDAEGTIEYVNPAFTRVSGYSAGEVLGHNPRILNSGLHRPAFYTAMWAALTSGRTFSGVLTNRRKDGTLFEEEAVISPILDAAGSTTSYVAVKRDVTRERALEAAHQRIARERAIVTGALGALPVLPSASATARAICEQTLALPGVASVSLAYFTLEGPALSLAFVRADGADVTLRRLPRNRSRTLRERAAQGPWVEAWVRRPAHPYSNLHDELATRALAYVPLRHDGRLIGLLTATSGGDDATERLVEFLPTLVEIATISAALVGPAMAALTEVDVVRERIADIIGTGAYTPVFQPIVDLATDEHVGFEALTRFANGTPPDVVFADARAAGLDADLEVATLTAAIAAAAALPKAAWLSLNVSPSLVVRDRRLGGLLREADRPVVLEVTEHVAVEDYGVLRGAVGRLRPPVRIAVDDAGAGVANFNHIVELRPAYVKLDIGFTRGIDTDRTRMAMVLGLQHFAEKSGCETIAEGVETRAELETLRGLGVPFAQGYLLGAPAPVDAWRGADDEARTVAAASRTARSSPMRRRAALGPSVRSRPAAAGEQAPAGRPPRSGHDARSL